MDQRHIDSLITKRLPALRLISLGFVASVLTYIGAAGIYLRMTDAKPLLELPFAVVAAIAASQFVVVLAGYLLSGSIRAGAEGAARAATTDPEERAGVYMQRYVQSVVVGTALREVAAIVGLVLSMLTGEILWVVLLGGVALTSMLVHWPRQGAVEEWFSQQGLRN